MNEFNFDNTKLGKVGGFLQNPLVWQAYLARRKGLKKDEPIITQTQKEVQKTQEEPVKTAEQNLAERYNVKAPQPAKVKGGTYTYKTDMTLDEAIGLVQSYMSNRNGFWKNLQGEDTKINKSGVDKKKLLKALEMVANAPKENIPQNVNNVGSNGLQYEAKKIINLYNVSQEGKDAGLKNPDGAKGLGLFYKANTEEADKLCLGTVDDSTSKKAGSLVVRGITSLDRSNEMQGSNEYQNVENMVNKLNTKFKGNAIFKQTVQSGLSSLKDKGALIKGLVGEVQ